jgi:hypothetical protein
MESTTASLVHRGRKERLASGILACGQALILLSTLYTPSLNAQARGSQPAQPQAAQPQPSQPQPSQPQPSQPPQPTAPLVAPSLLQEPAHDAQIDLNSDKLYIRADNSSLTAILHQIATKSGMQIEGLGADERVFGTFGPGAPRDVLADLLNGTAYNVVLLGDLNNGAPRQLTLTPASRGGATPAPTPAAQANADDAANEPDPEPPPPEPQQPATPPPGTPGVRTPQQLFEQLQRMRQAQQQQGNGTQDQQQQQQPQQQQQQQQQQPQPQQ